MGIVKIEKPWNNLHDQKVDDDQGNVWKIPDLIERAKDLPIVDIPTSHIALNFKIGNMSVLEFVSHMKLILDANMDYPVILDEEACVFDGRHRIAKALLNEYEKIKTVRFEKDPPPTYIESK